MYQLNNTQEKYFHNTIFRGGISASHIESHIVVITTKEFDTMTLPKASGLIAGLLVASLLCVKPASAQVAGYSLGTATTTHLWTETAEISNDPINAHYVDEVTLGTSTTDNTFGAVSDAGDGVNLNNNYCNNGETDQASTTVTIYGPALPTGVTSVSKIVTLNLSASSTLNVSGTGSSYSCLTWNLIEESAGGPADNLTSTHLSQGPTIPPSTAQMLTATGTLTAAGSVTFTSTVVNGVTESVGTLSYDTKAQGQANTSAGAYGQASSGEKIGITGASIASVTP